MPTVGGLSSGLAALPAWLGEGPPFEERFAEWVRASGYRAAGLVWPAGDAPRLARFADAAGAVTGVGPVPPELPQVLATLAGGPPTTVWPLPQSSGRLYTLVDPPGEAAGLLYAERAPGPWGEVDRNYLTLSARLMARSPALAAHTDSPIGPDRLSERLADAALIAGRVAHDFAGILTGVCGYGDLAGQLLPADSRVGELVARIARVGERGMTLTRRVREFSTCGDAKPTPGSVALVARREAARLDLVTSHWPEFAPDLPAVAMDAGPLGLVLGHLLANALEAVPASGPVEVSAHCIELTAAAARDYRGAPRPGACVEVTVRDHGPGIAPAARRKLFAEPFVTTKPRHPGLGLAVAFRALAAHGGGLRLDPAAPGTAARFVAPVAPRTPGAGPKPPRIPAHSSHQTQG